MEVEQLFDLRTTVSVLFSDFAFVTPDHFSQVSTNDVKREDI